MKRYLLFDAGCAVCNQIAQAIEEAASGKLQVVSLRDPQAVQWLEQVYPEGWAYRPYLVVVEGDRVRAYAGPGMAMRLGWLLGPRKAWRVWSLARRYGVMLPPGGEYSAERRGFLKRATLFVVGLFFFPRLGSSDGQSTLQELDRNIIVRQLRGEALKRAVQMALEHKDGQVVKDFFAAHGYQAQTENSTGVKVENKRDRHEAIAVSIPFENGIELGKMVFIWSNSFVRAGAGLLELSDGAITAIDVYEAHDGSMQYAGRLERAPNGEIVVRNSSGDIRVQQSIRKYLMVPGLKATNCEICQAVFAYIYAAGCGIAGYLVCNLACAPFGGPACPIICAAVYAMLCVFGYEQNVDIVCEPWCG